MLRAVTLLVLSCLARSTSLPFNEGSNIPERRRLLNLRSLQRIRVTITLTRDTAESFTTAKQEKLLNAFKATEIYKLHETEGGSAFPERSDVLDRKITAISTLEGDEMVRCSRPRGKYPCVLWNSGMHKSGLKVYFELSASRAVMGFVLSAIENGEMAVWLRDKLMEVDELNEYVTFSIPAVSDTAYPQLKVKPLPVTGSNGTANWEVEDWAILAGMICLGFAIWARLKSRSRESLYELAARRERRWEERRAADTKMSRRKAVEMSTLANAFTLREHQEKEMDGSEFRRRYSDSGDMDI